MTTKHLIIEAATRLFAEKGYEGMTMKEIAKEVGIKAPSLYAFFESKEDIFLHIYRDTITNHLDLARAIADSTNEPVKKQLEDMLRSIMEYQLQEPLRMKIYMRLLLFPPEVFQVDMKADVMNLEQEEHKIFCELFKRGMDNGEIKQGDCHTLAATLICILDGLFWELQRYDEEFFWKRFHQVWNQFWQAVKQD